MTSAPGLGHIPKELPVNLLRGWGWSSGIRLRTGDFGAGAVVRLYLGEIVWTATVTGNQATWNRSRMQVDEVPDEAKTVVTYADDAHEETPWFVGQVYWYG